MPIYEFYCPACHALFNFLSRRPDARRRPACPRCKRPRLDRRPSRFAISRGRPEPTAGGTDLPEGFDEARLERMMGELAGELDGSEQDDPRRMAGVMRRLFDGAGLSVGPGMEEAIRRMEAGEDPDRIESEMGDLLEGEDELSAPGSSGGLKRLRRRLLAPEVDPTLYEL